MTPELLGQIPGPYGRPIAVYRDPANPDEFTHDMDGTMDIAGIYDMEKRMACRRAIDRATAAGPSLDYQIFLDHGGQKVPRAALARPEKPATLGLPEDAKIREVADNWATLIMDQPTWADRAKALLPIIENSMSPPSAAPANPFGFERVQVFATSILLTSALEHLAEKEIECLEQAAFYAMSCHDEWSTPAVEWLKPFRKTWFWDWAALRPQWQAFAQAICEVNPDLPGWIVRGAAR